MERNENTWTVAEARLEFCRMLERAIADGPQRITKYGRVKAVIVAVDDWDRLSVRKGNLLDFLIASPLRDSAGAP